MRRLSSDLKTGCAAVLEILKRAGSEGITAYQLILQSRQSRASGRISDLKIHWGCRIDLVRRPSEKAGRYIYKGQEISNQLPLL